MDEDRIKELISEKYPNAKPFWDNNKDWILNLVKEVQKESKIEVLGELFENEILTKKECEYILNL